MKNTRPHQPAYGWIRDNPDHRDFLFSERISPRKKLPRSVDLRGGCSVVENQSTLGSCTANALAGALEYLEIAYDGKPMDLSRLFLYYNERAMRGVESEDGGALLRDGIKTLQKQGICPEELWPYDIRQFAVKPKAVCYKEALKHQITSYWSIRTLDEAKASLAEGYPFAFGFSVFTGFETATVARTGVMNYPTSREKMLGGHAVLAVGYDDASKRFLVRNSWGEGWGQKGYFTMPYAYAFGDRTHQPLGADFWTIRQME
ncbi:MAG: C1 family peptidase [Verrucomicrobiota bacterium]